MTFDCDFHLHTTASDGRCSVAELARVARERGLRRIAVTDHSFSSLICHQTAQKFDAQGAEIAAEQGGLKIYRGIEANIVDLDGTLDVPDDIISRTEVLTAGFHRFVSLMFKRCSRKFLLVNGFLSDRSRMKLKAQNTEAYLKMLDRYPVDILAHVGHRCPVDYAAVAAKCAQNGVYIELNEKHILDTRGIGESIGAVLATGVKFIVGSDAHRADRVGRFPNVASFIEAHSIPLDRVYGVDGNIPVFKDRTAWKK